MLRFLLATFWIALSVPAHAGALIRDAGIEYAMRYVTAPITNAAGLSVNQLKIYLIHDRRLNAFALNGQTIVLFSGLTLRLDSIEQFQALLAHQIAHIRNGHTGRARQH